MTATLIVENIVQAKEKVQTLQMQGYSKDQIYIFAHSKERGEHISEALQTEEVGMSEQGIMDSIKNIFASRGDELRNKMQAVGLSPIEADKAEEELDKGKLVIVANRQL